MTNLAIRGALLFSVGVFLALVLNLLQVQRNVTLFPPDVISSIFSSAWWVAPCCGTASDTMATPTTTSNSNNAFSMDFFKNLTEHNKTGNVFYSPFSIFSALGMVLLGARGNTASQILESLKDQSGQGDVHADIKQLLSEINKANAPYKLSVANRLYGEQSYQFNKHYIKDTQKYYYAGLETVDFKNNSGEAVDKINSWVEEKTNEKIKDLLSKEMVNAMTRLVLVNAIYFKGNWNLPFDKYDTHDAEFKLNKNERKTVKMMSQESTFPLAAISEVNCQILEMPYKSKDLSMIIFLPNDIEDDTTGLEKLERELTYDRFVEWTSRVREVDVAVKLPQFKFEESYELEKILIGLGMGDAFDSKKCDFSGMSSAKDLVVSKVVHKAFVAVDEEGTEAAAATAVVMRLLSASLIRNTFFVDHPALFFIRHNSTNTILFSGRLASPE